MSNLATLGGPFPFIVTTRYHGGKGIRQHRCASIDIVNRDIELIEAKPDVHSYEIAQVIAFREMHP